MKNKNLFIALLLVPVFALSQTREERAKIASFSDKEGNAQLLKEATLEEGYRKARLEKYFAANPGVEKIKYRGQEKSEIIDVLPTGEIVYAKTSNFGAASTAKANTLYSGGALGLNIQGQGMIAGVWDGGVPRETHQEFMVGGVSKIQNMDGGLVDFHPTHVAGTIAAQGINPLVRGVAFNSSIKAYDWDSDITEMIAAAPTGLLTSNHSYSIGFLNETWFYGAYDNRARQIDNLAYYNPFYLPVIAAGNDRNNIDPPASTQILTKGGYDLIFGHGNAKNVITVAAVNQVANYTGPSSVVMSNFSSWGPSDDGRIKPDISMKGVAVRSTSDASDIATANSQGTSMAAPGVTGVVLLLQQYYNQLYSSYMRAATVKGLILHTAEEAGFSPGPDYEYGWGLINAQKSAIAIRDKNLNINGSVIEENSLANNATFTKTITASGTEPLQVSISWTDPAASAANMNMGTNDPTTKYLVNDLDLKVTGPQGTVYYPWKKAGLANLAAVATNNSTNDADNFERVDIANPSGTYTISVTHKGSLVSGSQNYSLVVTAGALTNLSVDDQYFLSDISISPNPVQNVLRFHSKKHLVQKVTVVDVTGRVVRTEAVNDNRMDLTELKSGAYFLICDFKDGSKRNFKILKK